MTAPVLCPRQSNKIEGVALNGGMCILGFFCPKQGQSFRLYTQILVYFPPPRPPFPGPLPTLDSTSKVKIT